MADNNDSFDEFLNRAEEDFDAANGDGEEDDLEGALADAEDAEADDDAPRGPGSVISDEMRAKALIKDDLPSAHGEIVEGANGGTAPSCARRTWARRCRHRSWSIP